MVKYVYRYEKDCCLAQIELTITIDQRLLTYTITNTGTMNLCNDIILCSKLFGKTCISNEYLSRNESVSVTKNMNDIRFPMTREYEKAGVFIKIKKNLRLCTETCIRFYNEQPKPGPINPDGYVTMRNFGRVIEEGNNFKFIFSIYNTVYSETDIRGIRFIIPFNGNFTSVVEVSNGTVIESGVKVEIPVIEIGSSRTVTVTFPKFTPSNVNFTIFGFRIFTENNIVGFSDYFTLTK